MPLINMVTGRFAPSLDVLPPVRFAIWTFRPLTGRFAPDCGRFAPCLLFYVFVFFHMGHVARVDKADWLIYFLHFQVTAPLHNYTQHC